MLVLVDLDELGGAGFEPGGDGHLKLVDEGETERASQLQRRTTVRATGGRYGQEQGPTIVRWMRDDWAEAR